MPTEVLEGLNRGPEYCKSIAFGAIDITTKAKLALDFADHIYQSWFKDLETKDIYSWPEHLRDGFTTALLRVCCGCETVTYFDELIKEWKVMESHDRGCHFARFPISEDLSDSTKRRRQAKEVLRSNADLLLIEEYIHAISAG